MVKESGLKDGGAPAISAVPCNQAWRGTDFLAEPVVTGQGAMVSK